MKHFLYTNLLLIYYLLRKNILYSIYILMIGILGQVGRIAGREIAEEALGRIVAGRTTEDLFAREEIARRVGKASFDSLIKKTPRDTR